MVERFSQRSRAVMLASQDEAVRLRQPYLGTEHLLLGLLGEEQETRPREGLLSLTGIELPAAREMVAAMSPPGDRDVEGALPFTPRVRTILRIADREAADDEIAPRHLLAGTLLDGWGIAVHILRRGKLDPDALLARARSASEPN